MEAFLSPMLSVAATRVDDKTQLLSLFLAVRLAQKNAIVTGIFIATLLNHLVSAMFGVWLAQGLSLDAAKRVTGTNFIAVGLQLLLLDKDEDPGNRWLKYGAFSATVALPFMVEIGGKMQIATVLLVVKYQELFMAVAGSVIGMMAASVSAVYLGEMLTGKIPIKEVRLAACVVFYVLGVPILLDGGLVLRQDRPNMLEILFCNQGFTAIDKPAGVAVHQEEGANNLLAVAMAQLNVPHLRSTHHLDKPTGGVLLLVLNAQTVSELAQQSATKTIRKTYLVLSGRRLTKKQGLVKGGMEKSCRGAWKLVYDNGANLAVMRFYSQSIAPNLRLSVLQSQAGKTHQLRVAMKNLSNPIFGDAPYDGMSAERLSLHMRRLEFEYRGGASSACTPLDDRWPSEIPGILRVPAVGPQPNRMV